MATPGAQGNASAGWGIMGKARVTLRKLNLGFSLSRKKTGDNRGTIVTTAVATVPHTTEVALTPLHGGTPVDITVWEEAVARYVAQLNPNDARYVRHLSGLGQDGLHAYLTSLTRPYSEQRAAKILALVQPIALAVKSLSRVVSSMVQANPEVAALVWGCFQLLLEMCILPTQLHERILGMLDTLSVYLPLFETWRGLFPHDSFANLASKVRATCLDLVSFVVQAIQFLRRSAVLNVLLSLVSPLSAKFAEVETNIKRHTEHLTIQIQTAEAESSRARHQVLHDMLKSSGAGAQAGSAPSISLPFRYMQHVIRNPVFFGREQELSRIHVELEPGRLSTASTASRLSNMVLHGLGGVGKSSIAVEYMYRHFDDYPVIIWLYADQDDKLAAQFAQLARFLGILDNGRTDKAHEDVLHWISNLDLSWLLVFDNADDMTVLAPYWPAAKHGAVLVTSRNVFPGKGSFATSGMAVRPLSPHQGARFVLRALPSDSPITDTDLRAAEAISNIFDGLPLGLMHASCFIQTKSCRPGAYFELWAQSRSELELTPIPGYQKNIANVWELSMNTLSQDSADVLDLLAVLDPDSVPAELFTKYGHLSDFSRPATGSALRYLNAVEGLYNQSLVDVKASGAILSLHRFFQDSTLANLRRKASRYQVVYRSVLIMLHAALPVDDFLALKHVDIWLVVETYIPHLERLYQRALEQPVEVEALNFLVHISGRVAGHYLETGQYGLGEGLLVRIEKLARPRPDISTATLSKVYYYHGRICQETNQPVGAVENLERALQLWQQSTEEEKRGDEVYPAILYENLGMSCIGAQRFDEAKAALQQAIDIARQPGAPCASVLGDFLQCLAACYLYEGNIDAAEEMVRRALLERCGANNENRGGALYTLGNVCLAQKKYDEALQVHQEVLRIYTEDLGPFHHWVADSCHKVGCILAIPEFHSRDLAKAEEYLRKSLSIWAEPSNTGTVQSERSKTRTKWKLAAVLRSRAGGASEADLLHREVCDFVLKEFGVDLESHDAADDVIDSLVWYWSR